MGYDPNDGMGAGFNDWAKENRARGIEEAKRKLAAICDAQKQEIADLRAKVKRLEEALKEAYMQRDDLVATLRWIRAQLDSGVFDADEILGRISNC